MAFIEKRNYLDMIDNINDDFSSNGWADGYADLPSDEENIILSLYNKVSYNDLLKYINEYLQGYEVGCDMSENALEIYDEDGCLLDDYNPCPCFTYYDVAREKITELFSKGLINSKSDGYSDFYKYHNLLEILLINDNPVDKIRNNMDYLLNLIPEIKPMIGFEQKHPHHHLDVFEHTLLALSKSECDFYIRLALLFHDIGKPRSFIEGDIRHYKGHANISSNMTDEILTNLGYNNILINNIMKLIYYHDTKICKELIRDDKDFCLKLYKIQKCDALAHHPNKLKKRIAYLKKICNELNIIDDDLEKEEKRLICKH